MVFPVIYKIDGVGGERAGGAFQNLGRLKVVGGRMS
jgi:hypothetical protein